MHPSYVFKLHPSICSPVPDHCAEHRIQMPRYSNPVCGTPYPTPSSPHVLLNCRVPPLSRWLRAAGGAPGTWETPSHSTCSHLDSVGASKGERWEEQPQLQKPLASQEHRLLLSVNFGTENTAGIPKEQGAQMESLQMEYLVKNTCQAPEFYDLVNSWGFFQNNNSHTPLPCCCIFPQISALTDELLGHVLKHTMTETTHRSYLTRAKIPCYEQHGHDTQRWINLFFAWTAMSLHHLKVHRKVLDILIYKKYWKLQVEQTY